MKNDVLGREPSADAYADAVAGNLATAAEHRRQLIARSLTCHDAALRLGVSTRSVRNMLRSGALIGLTEGRRRLLPAWQFDPAGPLPGLCDLASRFPGSVVALARWMERENPDLHGMTPRATLGAGNVTGVLGLIATI